MARSEGVLDHFGQWVQGSQWRARWLVAGVLALGFAAWTIAFERRTAPPGVELASQPQAEPKAAKALSSECPLGTLPDSGVCIPAPAAAPPKAEAVPGAPAAVADPKAAAPGIAGPEGAAVGVSR